MCAAVFLAVGGVLIYRSDAEEFDLLFPDKMREEREYRRIKKFFPDTIADYVIYNVGTDIQVHSECNTIENHPDTKVTGLTGEICEKIIRSAYRQVGGNKIVFVILGKFTKGSELHRQLVDRLSQPDKLNGYDIRRIERHEIAWYDAKLFDVVITQEGEIRRNPDGQESMSYEKQADGVNPVTQYFINRFPPAQ